MKKKLTKKTFYIPKIILLILSVILIEYPDIHLSNYIYSVDFSLTQYIPLITKIGDYLEYSIFFIAFIIGLYIISSLFKKNKKCLNLKLACFSFLISFVLIIFFTEIVLKGFWGRPRPYQTINFGGLEAFFPVWKINFSKAGNEAFHFKSFPSGHTALAFSLTSFIFSLKQLKHYFTYIVSSFLFISIGIFIASSRILSLNHFLSDTIAASCYSIFISKQIYIFIFKKKDLIKGLFFLNTQHRNIINRK